MAAKPRPALTRGSLMPSDSKSRRRPGYGVTSQSGLVSDTASTVSASQQSAYLSRDQLRLENTFKMNPDSEGTFSPKRVEEAARGVLESYLCDYDYDPKTAARLTCDLANMLKARVKEMGYNRYKVVCQVVVGERQDQGVAVVSRFLWDSKNDSHATASYSNGQLYAVASIYGLYYE